MVPGCIKRVAWTSIVHWPSSLRRNLFWRRDAAYVKLTAHSPFNDWPASSMGGLASLLMDRCTLSDEPRGRFL